MKKWLPLLIILAVMVLVYSFNLTHYFTFDMLKKNRQNIETFVSQHGFIAPLLYIALYSLSTTLSLPIGIYLSILGGLLFPQPFCTLYIVVGATLGASCVFLAAKTALGDFLRRKAGPRLQKMQREFVENGVSYLLFLRLVPLFPFWLVNLAPAFMGVRLRTFVWTTFFGIIPGAFVFAQAGTGIGAILDANQEFSIATVLNLQVKIALIALGIFALIPILIKRLRKKNAR